VLTILILYGIIQNYNISEAIPVGHYLNICDYPGKCETSQSGGHRKNGNELDSDFADSIAGHLKSFDEKVFKIGKITPGMGNIIIKD
jgi:hypothetical protein